MVAYGQAMSGGVSMYILVFTHGTIVMHSEALGVERAKRVRQSQQRIASVHDIAQYVPIGKARDKIWRWHGQGAKVAYLGPSRRPENIAKNETILRQLDFPPGLLYHRAP